MFPLILVALATGQVTTSVVLLNSTPNPVVQGQNVTITASVDRTAATQATGTITLTGQCPGVSPTTLGTITLTSPSSGAGTLQISSFPCLGENSIVAAYGGDSNYSSGVSRAMLETVLGQLTPASMTLTSSLDPCPTGQSTTFNATLNFTGKCPFTINNAPPAASPAALIRGALRGRTAPHTSLAPRALGAHAYVINFAGTGVILPTAGSFTYDPATGFSGFQVQWFGGTFDFTTAANNASGCGTTGPAVAFAMLQQSLTGCPSGTFGTYAWSASSIGEGAPRTFSLFYGASTSSIPDIALSSTAACPNASCGRTLAGGTWTIRDTSMAPGPTVSCPLPPANTGVVGSAFDSLAMSVTGGTAPYTFTVVGTLPGGLNLNSSTGEITGTPTAAGAFSVMVTDAAGVVATNNTLPSGTVTFTDTNTGNTLGSANLITIGGAGITSTGASFTVWLGAGSYAVQAVYSGDSVYAASASSLVNQVVQQLTPNPTNTALTADMTQIGAGQSISLTAAVSSTGGIPTGIVSFSDGTSLLGALDLDSTGQVTLTTSALAVGTHTITAAYSGDTNFATSIATLNAVVQPATLPSTTTALSSSADPGTVGGAVVLAATVSSASSGTPLTGTVTFQDGSTTTLGTAAVQNGIAALSAYFSAAGTHPVSASYSGDSNFAAGVGMAAEVVNPPGSPGLPVTTTAISSSANPSAYGQTITFTATVTGTAAPIVPTGAVTFSTGSMDAIVSLNSTGTAVFTTSALSLGTVSVSAVYSGDTNYAGSVSPGLGQTVNQDSTTTTLAVSPDPPLVGSSVTFTATVSASSPGAGTPTGAVSFVADSSQTLCASVVLQPDGTATCTISALTIGPHTIATAYGGDANFLPSSTSIATTVVQQVTLTSINPIAGVIGSVVPVTLTGTNLTAVTAVTVSGTGVTPGAIAASADGTTLTTSFTIAATAALTARTVSLTAPNGVIGTVTFTVTGPTLTSITPSTGVRNTIVPATLVGTNLTGATVTFSAAGVTAGAIAVSTDGTTLTTTLTIAATAALAGGTVSVTTPIGVTNTVPFTVVNPPAATLTSVAPNTGSRGTAVPVTLTGSSFTTATAVTIAGTGVTLASAFAIVNDTTITATLNITAAATIGAHNVTVTNPAGTTAGVPFTVIAPTLTSIAPNTGVRNTAVPVTLVGANLTGATAVTVSGTGVTVGGITVSADGKTLNTTLTIAATATLSARTISVTTPIGVSNTVTFTVVNPPAATLTTVAPNTGMRGAAVPVTLTGSSFTTATAVTVAGTGVSLASAFAIVNDTTITATFNITTAATVGAHNVTVTNPAGTTAGVPFTVIGPTLTSISPNTGVRNTAVPVNLAGANLTGATAVTVSGTGVTASTPVVSSSGVTTTLTITAGAALGARTVTVTTPLGVSNTVPFTVVNPPAATLTTVAPNTGLRGTAVPVTLTGSSFTTATAVTVAGTGVTLASAFAMVNDTTITATFNITAAATLGAHNVTVTNPAGTTAGVPFTVQGPTLSSVTPNTGVRNTAVPVTLFGANLTGATAVTVSGTGVTASTPVVSSSGVTTTLTITAGAALGARTVTVTTPLGVSNTVPFTVVNPPAATLTTVAPNTGLRGTAVPVTLTGSSFTTATAVTVAGTGVTLASAFAIVNDTTITATFNITAAATLGAHNVTVTNPAGTTAGVPFTVQGPTLSSVTPNTGVRNTAVPVTLLGANLTGATAVTVSGTGVTASTPVVSSSSVTTTLTITAGAALGARTVTVTTPIGVTTGTVNFQVTGATVTFALPNLTTTPGNLTAKTGTLTVTNATTATGALTFTAAPAIAKAAGGAGGTGTGTATVTGGTCVSGLVVNPGSSCTVNVQWVPTNTSTANLTVTIAGTGLAAATLTSGTFPAN